MSMSMRRLVAGLLAAIGLSLTGCGAGLIGGVASSGSGGGAEVSAPQLNIADGDLPMAPRAGDVRTVIVAGAQLAGAVVEVKIESSVGVAAQRNVIAQLQGSSTIVSFELSMDGIHSLNEVPAVADLPATLSVIADGVVIGDPINVTLVRRPVASLVFVSASQTEAELSPFGESVRIAVDGLRTADPSLLQVLVTTPDPEAGVLGATTTRLATEVEFVVPPQEVPTIRATIPGSPFPAAVTIQVLDPIAGQSTVIKNAFYRPEFALALPGQGATTGGTLLTLIGSALVPYDFGAVPAQYDFDRITLTLAKGGRVTEVPSDDIRVAESARDRLVFTIPPSPDGRPGVVDIILKVSLKEQDVTVTAKLFLFANPDPVFGPRGVVLDSLPVRSAPIQLDNAPETTDAPDFAVLTEQGGVGFVQLLLALQNGMFQPFAAPTQIGDHAVAAERKPRDLLVGDFDGDNVPDMFVVNEGDVGGAVHHVVLGQSRPDPPLGATVRVHAPVGAVMGRVAFLDGDDLPDVLLVPPRDATGGPPVQVLLSRPTAFGEPSFLPMPSLDFGEFAYEALEVADFNGDGVMDVAVASGSDLRITTMLGNGDGSFVLEHAQTFTSIPLYGAPDDRAPAVGLHSCQDGLRPSLALVLAGSKEVQGMPGKLATVAVFPQVFDQALGEWGLIAPAAEGVFVAPQIVEPLSHSLVANIDELGPVEMVLAVSGEPTLVSGGLLQFDEALRGFVPLEIESVTGTEDPVNVSDLVFATAFPGDTPASERQAVFVVHEVDVDGVRERRISTRLVQRDVTPRLLPPDAGGGIPLEIDGIVAGLFTGDDLAPDRSALDLALATKGAGQDGLIQIIDNDGFGGFPQLDQSLTVPNLLPQSVALLPGAIGQSDSLVCLSSDGTVTVWDPDLAELRGAQVQARALNLPDTLRDDSVVQIADVDRDGFLDVVLLLSFESTAPGRDDSLLAIMRGKSVTVGEFPFETPTTMTPVHRNASSFTLANFTEVTDSLELALAVPQGTEPTSLDGNHVLFFKYVAGPTLADSHYQMSSEENGPEQLLAGSRPTLVASSDLDGDGVSDLIVACEGDRTLRLFRNTDAPGGLSTEVNVGAFEEALGSPWALGVGGPTVMKLSDVNGDGNLDVVVVTEFTGSVTTSSVASYLSTGTGDFAEARFASDTRAGPFSSRLSLDLGDWNSDGVPDLFLGWGMQLAETANLRVLFGGTK